MEPQIAKFIFVLIVAFIALGFLSVIYRIVKYKGIKGGAFGAQIASTVGELELHRREMTKRMLKVHRLAPGADQTALIGLELTFSRVGGYRMIPVALTRDEATRLAGLLTRAAAHPEAGVRGAG